MKRPAISIGMPVYNGEHFLSRSLDSLLAQDFADFELIIVDNASLDSTPSICEMYARRDSRVRYFRNPVNVGAAPNHTLAFNYSSAPYFKWAAHDDECKPSLLRRCLETFEAGPSDLQLVYPQAEIIDEKGDVQELYTVSIDCRSGRPSRRVARVLKEVRLGTPMYGLFRSETLKRTRLIDSF